MPLAAVLKPLKIDAYEVTCPNPHCGHAWIMTRVANRWTHCSHCNTAIKILPSNVTMIGVSAISRISCLVPLPFAP